MTNASLREMVSSSGLSNEQTARVLRVLEDYLAELERGGRPHPEELMARHPDLAELLKEYLDRLDLLHEAAVRFRVTEPPTGVAADAAENDLGRLGDFQLLREIGRGGMGIVYEAEQISLNRRVALKVLPFAATMDARQLQRFQNEARAAAGLHHTNIVAIYYVGSERRVYYYAMQFIEGRDLASLVTQLREQAGHKIPEPEAAKTVDAADGGAIAPTALPTADTRPIAGLSTERSTKSREYFRSVARLGIQVAEALDHAHQMGIVHRDVKPANLLVDAVGRLWVTDFGLAQIQSDTRLTMTGDLIGTLRYMSPEQALAKRVVVDHRTDIYSLGATLYELLTLEPAFTGGDRQELLRQIAFEEPRRPRRLNRAIPQELETIVLKAMERNPADRYATAQELADDLCHFVEDRPIVARPTSRITKAWRWTRRNPLAAGIMITLIVGIVTSTALTAWALWERDRARRNFEAARKARFMSDMSYLHRDILLQEDRIWWVNHNGNYTDQEREEALAIVRTMGTPTDPRKYFEKSWEVVRDTKYGQFPDGNPIAEKIARERLDEWREAVEKDRLADLRFTYALHHAEAACRLDPKNMLYLTGHGMALYRLDRFSEALAVLANVDQNDGCAPYAVAFSAMAHFKLGHKDEAHSQLAVARHLISALNWADDFDGRAFLDEATFLIEAQGKQPAN